MLLEHAGTRRAATTTPCRAGIAREHELARDVAHGVAPAAAGQRRAGAATRARRMRSKCAGSCACVSSPGRGRWRSYSRDSQKRSAAARSSDGHASRSSARQRTHRVVGARPARAASAGSSGAAVRVDAPVVDGDREVVGEEVGRREAEVDDAGDAVAVRTARCRRRGRRGSRPSASLTRPKPVWNLISASSSAACDGGEIRLAPRARPAPPRGPAPVGEPRAIRLRREVQPRERRADAARSARRRARRSARRRRARRGPRACR